MRFRFSHLFFVMSLVAGVSACTREVGPHRTEKKMGGELNGCLKGYQQKLSDYFDGKSDDKTVGDLFDCYSSAMKTFASQVRGERNGQFKPGEIKGFIETYFLKNEKLPDDLIRELVALHGVVLGSPTEVLTLESLDRIQEVFGILKTEFIRLRPYMPLTPEHFSRHSVEEIEELAVVLNQTAQNLAKIFDRAVTTYPKERLNAFVQGLTTLIKSSRTEASSWIVRSDLLLSLNEMFMGGDGKSIRPGDWGSLLRLSLRSYANIVRLHAVMQQNEFLLDRPESIERLSVIYHEFTDMLKESVARHGSELPFAAMDSVCDHLTDPLLGSSFGLYKLNITAPTLKFTIQVIIKRLFGGPDETPEGRAATGITLKHLDRMNGYFKRWKDTQLIIYNIYKELAEEKKVAAGTPMRSLFFPRVELLKKLEKFARTRAITREESFLNDLRNLIEMPAYYLGDTPIADLSPGFRTRDTSYFSLSTVTWLWSLYRMAIIGSVPGPMAKLGSVIHKDDFKSLYLDLKPIATELKAFDPRFEDSSMRRFREANLFTTYADGDEFLTIREAVESAAFMFSIKFTSFKIHDEVMGLCEQEGKLRMLDGTFHPDPYGFKQATLECYGKYYFQPDRLKRFWQYVPELYREYSDYRRTNPARANHMQSLLLEMANQSIVAEDKKYINSIDTDGLTIFTMYLDSMFQRFDTQSRNGKLVPDGLLDLDEAWNMLKVFKEFLRKVGKQVLKKDVSDDDLWAVLTYALARGEMPDGAGDIIWWYSCDKFFNPFCSNWKDSVHADRTRVLELLVTLKRLVKDDFSGFHPDATYEDGADFLPPGWTIPNSSMK